MALRGFGGWQFRQRMAEIRFQHRVGLAVRDDPAFFQPHHARTPGADDLHGVAGQHQNFGAAHHILQPHAGIFHEHGIARQNPFVHQQNLPPDGRCQREAKPEDHAETVDPHRHFHEIAQFGEMLHVVFQPAQGGGAKPIIQAAQADIARELGCKSKNENKSTRKIVETRMRLPLMVETALFASAGWLL